MSHKRKPEGILYHPAYGRVMVHKRFSLSIHWSEAMIAYLRKHYPTTINSELAECFNMSSKTMIRKAQSLGLKKDPEWLLQLKRDNVRIAKAANKRKGWPGRFKMIVGCFYDYDRAVKYADGSPRITIQKQSVI